MTLGERIKAARLKKGYSQAELAELLGYKSRSSINKIEVEGRDIPRSSIVKFAKILDVTPSYLMGWEQSTDSSDSADNTIIMEAAEKINLMEEAVNNELPLTPHEKKVITAYRSRPEMQTAVDTLLGVEKGESELIKVQVAARSSKNTKPHYEYITKAENDAEDALLQDPDEDM